jgi:hypothetical protein
LIENRPLDADRTLRLGPRWREVDHLALDAQNVTGANWSQPAQFVDGEAQHRMRPERTKGDEKPHRRRSSVPARGGQTFEDRFLGCSFVEMKRLRIELGGKTLDIASGDFGFATLVPHADFQVVEPFDHGNLHQLFCVVCSSQAGTVSFARADQRLDFRSTPLDGVIGPAQLVDS